ncbi:hypothetical protein NEF87_001065 [Candidatus Lokiarchaeum ossiferum]|uniref:Caspase family protein n=1 Tax=Candidatus Lokiarchaeum ossiferum TaxID=2951803 RepID=A0ABY6HN03_9ARCH|nr:hypothetical protein NEF87_001065 [Candidatus Lokiarchaeum sp. B-35]
MKNIRKVQVSIIFMLVLVSSTGIEQALAFDSNCTNESRENVKISIYYDPKDDNIADTVKRYEQINFTPDLQMTWFEISTFADLNRMTKTDDSIKIFVFHGIEEGFQINNEVIEWNKLSNLLKNDNTQYNILMQCFSSKIGMIPDKKILSYEEEVDIEIAYIDSLFFLSDFMRGKNDLIGEKLFNFAIEQIEELGYEYFERINNPKESLGLSSTTMNGIEKNFYYICWLKMFEQLSYSIENTYYPILNEFSLLHDVNVASLQAVGLIFTGLFGAATLGIPGSAIFSISTALISASFTKVTDYSTTSKYEDAKDNLFNSQSVETDVDALLSILPDDIVAKIGKVVVSQAIKRDYVNLIYAGMLDIIMLESLETELGSTTSPGRLENDYVLKHLKGTSGLMSKMREFVDALNNNFDNVKAKALSVKNIVENINNDENYLRLPSFLSKPWKAFFHNLEEMLDNFIDNSYPIIDKLGSSFAYQEFYYRIHSNYWDDKIWVSYEIRNPGGNQVPIVKYHGKYTESTQGNVHYEDINFFTTSQNYITPGNSFAGSFTINRRRFVSGVSVPHVFDLEVVDYDTKGTTYRYGYFRNGVQYFPKTSYARINFNLGTPITQVFVAISQRADSYSRYFRIRANGAIIFERIVGSGTYYFTPDDINLNGKYTSLTFEIYWGGYKYQGWSIDKLLIGSKG